MEAAAVVQWVATAVWVVAAGWVYVDARRAGRPAVWPAVATLLLPGLGLGVYLGQRSAARRDADPELGSSGTRVLRELTAEVERLRRELDDARAELSRLRA